MMLVKVVAVPPDSDMLSKRSYEVCFICGNRGINQSYHKFPKERKRREQWCMFCKIPSDANLDNKRLCIAHFDAKQKILTTNHLKWNAVPTIYTTKQIQKCKIPYPTELRASISTKMTSILTKLPNSPETIPVASQLHSGQRSSANENKVNETPTLTADTNSSSHSEMSPVDVCKSDDPNNVDKLYFEAGIPSHSPVREKWLQALKINESNPSIRVCSIHFQKDDFRKLGENSKKLLHKNAIPSKLLTVRFGETKLAQTMQKCSKRCCVCGIKDASLAYHSFPAEPTMRKKWADACGFEDHLSLRTKQICERHFLREDYNYCMKINPKADKSRRTLRKTVVPTLELARNACQEKSTIVSTPPPLKPLAPKSSNTLVFKSVNNLSNVTMPPAFTQMTPVSVNPAVLSSLCVVLGDKNSNQSEGNPKITQVNSSSSKTVQQHTKNSSILSVKPAQKKSPIVVQLDDSDDAVSVDKTNTTSKATASTKTNSSAPAQINSVASTKTKSSAPTTVNSSVPIQTKSSICAEANSSAPITSDSNDSRSDEDTISAVLDDDENSNFSIEELILEELSEGEENEISSNAEGNSQPTRRKRSAPIARPSLPTKYRPILPAPSLTAENIKLIEALALKNGLRTAENANERISSRPPVAMLWRYPSDIGPAHCNTPVNAWRAVQILKSTIEKQRTEIRGLQQFKRRTLAKMQKMNEELQTLKQKQKAENPEDVEPWWV